jgi:alpha-L-rhamnosidase
VTLCPEVYPQLQHISASVNTVRGELSSSWKVDADNRLTMTFTVPVGTTADILLPVPQGHEVQLNGAPLATQTGVLEIGASGDRTLVRVTSGTFQFDLGTNALTK